MDAPTIVRGAPRTRKLGVATLTSTPFPRATTPLTMLIGTMPSIDALKPDGDTRERYFENMLQDQRVGVEGEIVFDAFQALMEGGD